LVAKNAKWKRKWVESIRSVIEIEAEGGQQQKKKKTKKGAKDMTATMQQLALEIDGIDQQIVLLYEIKQQKALQLASLQQQSKTTHDNVALGAHRNEEETSPEWKRCMEMSVNELLRELMRLRRMVPQPPPPLPPPPPPLVQTKRFLRE